MAVELWGGGEGGWRGWDEPTPRRGPPPHAQSGRRDRLHNSIPLRVQVGAGGRVGAEGGDGEGQAQCRKRGGRGFGAGDQARDVGRRLPGLNVKVDAHELGRRVVAHKVDEFGRRRARESARRAARRDDVLDAGGGEGEHGARAEGRGRDAGPGFGAALAGGEREGDGARGRGHRRRQHRRQRRHRAHHLGRRVERVPVHADADVL